jgi:hypothetical protein
MPSLYSIFLSFAALMRSLGLNPFCDIRQKMSFFGCEVFSPFL